MTIKNGQSRETDNIGHKQKTLDTNTKHWTKTQNTGHKQKTLDKNTKHWTQTQNTGQKQTNRKTQERKLKGKATRNQPKKKRG